MGSSQQGIRHRLWVVVRVYTLLLVGAVGHGGQPGAWAGAPTLKVALLVSGPVDDRGWNQLAYEGLLQIHQELGAEVAWRQLQSTQERIEALRDYGRQGFHLVLGHGEEYADPVAQVAPQFPKTAFVTTGGGTVLPNAAPIRLQMEEATYLLGIIAAGVSRTGQAGLIGGEELENIQRTFDAFKAGARSVNERFRVTIDYLGNWTDREGARQLALARIREGADILFPNADAANLGVFQAASESRSQSVYALGANGNQNDVAPEVILASAVLDIPRAFRQVAAEVQEGRFKGEVRRLGMKDGFVGLVYNPRLEARIPSSVREQVEEAQKQILAGALDPLTGRPRSP